MKLRVTYEMNDDQIKFVGRLMAIVEVIYRSTARRPTYVVVSADDLAALGLPYRDRWDVNAITVFPSPLLPPGSVSADAGSLA